MPDIATLFYVKEWHYLLTWPPVIIFCTTDRPCHLWLRHTTVEPQKHPKPLIRRGVALNADLRLCFVAYQDNEQEEDGDTLYHTFLKPSWIACITYWFYFHGEIAGQPSPSTSPFFTLHLPIPPRSRLFYEPWTYYTPPPPKMYQLFLEPWGEEAPPPPTWKRLFAEPWTSYWEPTVLLFREEWTYFTPPPPPMEQLFAEPWTA